MTRRKQLWIEFFRAMGIGAALVAVGYTFGLVHSPPEVWAADIVFIAIWLHSEVERLD